MLRILKKFIPSLFNYLFAEEIQKKLILKAKLLSLKNKNLKKIKNLSDVEFQVFSQWGEDGIIDWLVNKIPGIPNNFLEIGTQDYKESNTRFLLINKNWDGFIIEANGEDIKKIKKQRLYWRHNLVIKKEFITANNINKVVRSLNVPKKLGLLSLDIDGVDYWILKELTALEPYIVVCEYNSLFGQKKALTVPYKKNFDRSNEHYSNLYYGASIKAFENLMKRKKYFLLGTNSAGNNAFFVKKNIWKKLSKTVLKKKIFCSKFRESRNLKGSLSFLDKKKSLLLIKDKNIIDLNENKKKRIIDLNLANL